MDWWTIRGDRWGVENFDFKVELKKQGAITPKDLAEYNERDLYLFHGGDWCFVKMRVVPVDRCLVDMVGSGQVVSGIEWGQMADAYIDREEVTESQAKEAAIEAVRALRMDRIYVGTRRDSEFAEEVTTAPF